MTDNRRPPAPTSFVEGHTRIGLNVTRAPADTPRGRLHRTAALGARAAHRVNQTLALNQDDLNRMRSLAQRGVDRLKSDESRGARLIVHVCRGLDQTLAALVPLLEINVSRICEELTATLMMLEGAENKVGRLERDVADLKQDVAFERAHVERLRSLLATEQVRGAAVLATISPDRFDVPTRTRALTSEERAMIDDDSEK
jgi:hypothetical protein